MSDFSKGPSITIPINTAVSNAIPAKTVYSDAVGIMIYSPASLDAHSFILQVAQNAASPTWVDYEDENGDDIATPDAAKARSYFGLPLAGAFRIKDITGNVAAERTWLMSKLYKKD